MAESETYEGGCHCGRVRYRATTTLDRIIDCNCSFCTKRGVLWNYVQPSNFELLAGEQDLADYQSTTRSSTTCSAATAAWDRIHTVRPPMARASSPFASLNLTPFDGKSL